MRRVAAWRGSPSLGCSSSLVANAFRCSASASFRTSREDLTQSIFCRGRANTLRDEVLVLKRSLNTANPLKRTSSSSNGGTTTFTTRKVPSVVDTQVTIEEKIKSLESNDRPRLDVKEVVTLLDDFLRYALKNKVAKFRNSPLLTRIVQHLLPKISGGNSMDCHALLVRLAVLGKTGTAFTMFDSFRAQRIHMFQLTYGYMVELCGADVNKAHRLLESARETYGANKLHVLIYNCLIKVCAKNKDMTRALAVFDEMRASGLKPHWTTFSALLEGFVQEGLLDEGIVLLSAMKRYFGPSYRLATQWYTALLQACTKDADFDQVVALMASDNVIATDHTLKCIITDTSKIGGLPLALKTFQKLRSSLPEDVKEERHKIAIPKPTNLSLIAAGMMTGV